MEIFSMGIDVVAGNPCPRSYRFFRQRSMPGLSAASAAFLRTEHDVVNLELARA